MRYLAYFSFSLLFLLGLYSCGTSTASSDANTALVATETTTTSPAAEEKPTKDGLQIGDTAPDFKLEGTDGQMHSLATTVDANGKAPKGYIVTFTCNTCPYAKGYEERLVALHEKLSPMGYPVVAIQPNDVSIKPDDDLPAMKVRAAERKFGFAYLLDREQSVFPVYGATKTPEIYLLDADKVLRYHGAIDDSAQDPEGVSIHYVEAAVAALEAGKEPDPQSVKAIGCTIKVK